MWRAVLVLLASCGVQEDAPRVASVSPAKLCGSGAATLAIAGANFSPLPVATLTGAPRLELPRVWLRSAGLRVEGLVSWQGQGQLAATLLFDGGAAVWDVIVENPDGQGAILPAALTTLARAPLTISRAAPALVCLGSADVTVTLTGTGFDPAAQLALADASGQARLLPAPQVSRCGGNGCATLTFVVPGDAALAPGPYTLRVSGPARATCTPIASIRIDVGDPATSSLCP